MSTQNFEKNIKKNRETGGDIEMGGYREAKDTELHLKHV